MANFQDGNDFHRSNHHTKKLLTTVRMSRFKIQGLYFAWPWKIWVWDKTRPTAYLKRRLPCWGSLEKNTNNRWHLRRVSDYIVVSPQLRLISKKEAGGREDPEKLGFGPFSETFSTRLVDDTLNYQKDADWKLKYKYRINKSIEFNKIHHYFLCTSFAGRMNY